MQPPYNLFEREAETDILPYAKAHDLVALGYASLCRGLLTGKITETTTFKGDDLRTNNPKFKQDRRGQYLAAVAKLQILAEEKYGKSLVAFAERWLLDRGNNIALWGARRSENIVPVGDIVGWHIDDATLREIDDIRAETITDPVGPEFLAPPPAKAA